MVHSCTSSSLATALQQTEKPWIAQPVTVSSELLPLLACQAESGLQALASAGALGQVSASIKCLPTALALRPTEECGVEAARGDFAALR